MNEWGGAAPWPSRKGREGERDPSGVRFALSAWPRGSGPQHSGARPSWGNRGKGPEFRAAHKGAGQAQRASHSRQQHCIHPAPTRGPQAARALSTLRLRTSRSGISMTSVMCGAHEPETGLRSTRAILKDCPEEVASEYDQK